MGVWGNAFGVFGGDGDFRKQQQHREGVEMAAGVNGGGTEQLLSRLFIFLVDAEPVSRLGSLFALKKIICMLKPSIYQ